MTNGTTNISTDSDSKAVIEAAKQFGAVEAIEIDGGPDGAPTIVLSVPAGRKVESIKKYLDEYLPAPERKTGTARLTTLDSFIAHVNRHKDENTAIFAVDDQKAPKFVAVYDYNEKGPTGAARFGQHRAEYMFPVSDAWQAWTSADGKPMKQDQFAGFIEDRIGEVINPDDLGGGKAADFAAELGIDLASKAKLMTLSRGLSVKVGVQVVNAVNLTSGEGQITFAEEHKDENGNQLRVPGGFAIGIPIFRGGAGYRLPVRLRYRREGGAIYWIVSLHRTDLAFQDAFGEAAKKAEDDTDLPLFYGTPEA